MAIPKVSPVTASILCMKPRGQLTPEEAEKVDSLKVSLPNFAVMRGLAMRFRGILCGDDPSRLDSWLNDARATGLYGIRRFAQILHRDIDAVRNAISERWSHLLARQFRQRVEAHDANLDAWARPQFRLDSHHHCEG